MTRTESSFSPWDGLTADRVIGEVLDPAERACSGMVIGGVDVTLGIGCRKRRSRSAEASAEPSTLVSALTTSLAEASRSARWRGGSPRIWSQTPSSAGETPARTWRGLIRWRPATGAAGRLKAGPPGQRETRQE